MGRGRRRRRLVGIGLTTAGAFTLGVGVLLAPLRALGATLCVTGVITIALHTVLERLDQILTENRAAAIWQRPVEQDSDDQCECAGHRRGRLTLIHGAAAGVAEADPTHRGSTNG